MGALVALFMLFGWGIYWVCKAEKEAPGCILSVAFILIILLGPWEILEWVDTQDVPLPLFFTVLGLILLFFAIVLIKMCTSRDEYEQAVYDNKKADRVGYRRDLSIARENEKLVNRVIDQAVRNVDQMIPPEPELSELIRKIIDTGISGAYYAPSIANRYWREKMLREELVRLGAPRECVDAVRYDEDGFDKYKELIEKAP